MAGTALADFCRAPDQMGLGTGAGVSGSRRWNHHNVIVDFQNIDAARLKRGETVGSMPRALASMVFAAEKNHQNNNENKSHAREGKGNQLLEKKCGQLRVFHHHALLG